MTRLAALLLLVGLAEPRAELKLHGLFGDGMILQRDAPCPVWGCAARGADISVSILGQTKATKAGADGRWMLKLDPIPAGGPHTLKVNQITIRDVLVGDVWLASGGANMEMPVKTALISKTEPDDSPVAMIRFFVVPRRDSDKPLRDPRPNSLNPSSPTRLDTEGSHERTPDSRTSVRQSAGADGLPGRGRQPPAAAPPPPLPLSSAFRSVL